MRDSSIAVLSTLVAGLAVAAVGVALLDVQVDKEFLGAFVLIPVGVVVIAATIWTLVSRHVSGD